MSYEARIKLLRVENYVLMDYARALFEVDHAESLQECLFARVWEVGCEVAAKTLHDLRTEGRTAMPNLGVREFWSRHL